MSRTLHFAKVLITAVLYLAIANMTGGCTYYKVRGHLNPENRETASKAIIPQKYIIIHLGKKAWHLSNIMLNEAQTDMTGVLEQLPPEHLSYKLDYLADTGRHVRGPIRYKPGHSKPTHEIHIYLADGTTIKTDGRSSIPLESVRKIEIYDPAIGATIASHVFTALGFIAAFVLVIGIIALATKSSCPFLYVRNGDIWQFTGEMYGGAIALPLERDDYMPLPPLQPADGSYELKIANELKERQYTNIAELIIADHAPGTTVLADKAGNLHAIAHPVSTQSAESGSTDCSKILVAKDSLSFLFDQPDLSDPAFSNLILSFPRPAAAQSGKLVINAKNSYWLDYMFGRFTAQFGTGYNKFAAQQKKTPAAEGRQWSLEQGIPLSVDVLTEKGWEAAGYFDVIGPLAARDMVMQIDLSHTKGQDVKLRLRCGARFWELDYAAMDFTTNVQLAVTRLAPFSAIDEKGRELVATLTTTDHLYLEQPEPGNAAAVRYKVPKQPQGTTRSLIFHSRGYYEYVRSYTNKPNLIRLLSFKKAGAFTHFAATEYRRFADQKDILAAALNN